MPRPQTPTNPKLKQNSIIWSFYGNFSEYYGNFSQAPDPHKPIDKRCYTKEEVPICHDFNTGDGSGFSLAIGLLGGQVQIIDPGIRDSSKLFNAGEVSQGISMFIYYFVCQFYFAFQLGQEIFIYLFFFFLVEALQCWRGEPFNIYFFIILRFNSMLGQEVFFTYQMTSSNFSAYWGSI